MFRDPREQDAGHRPVECNVKGSAPNPNRRFSSSPGSTQSPPRPWPSVTTTRTRNRRSREFETRFYPVARDARGQHPRPQTGVSPRPATALWPDAFGLRYLSRRGQAAPHCLGPMWSAVGARADRPFSTLLFRSRPQPSSDVRPGTIRKRFVLQPRRPGRSGVSKLELVRMSLRRITIPATTAGHSSPRSVPDRTPNYAVGRA